MRLSEAAAGIVDPGYGVYNIGFGGSDETQLEAEGLQDLQEVWDGFRKENCIPEDVVDYLDRVERKEQIW